MKTLSRTTDPGTSREAARRVEASGRAQSLRDRVLFAVRRKQGRTAGELAQELGEERSEVSKRLRIDWRSTEPSSGDLCGRSGLR